MTISEIKQNAKESLRGRWGEIFKPMLLVYFVPLLLKFMLCLIGDKIGIRLLENYLSGDGIRYIKYLSIGEFIYVCVAFIILIITQVYFFYGGIESVISFVRREKVDLKRMFAKMIDSLADVFKINIRVLVEFIIISLICIILPKILTEFHLTLGNIASIVGMIIMIIKSFSLTITYVIANFIICDYDATVKENITISKEVSSKKIGKFITLIWSHLGWFLLSEILICILSYLKYFIWKPEKTLLIKLIDTSPSWFGIVVSVLEGIIIILLSIKILTSIAFFYESLKPDKIFDVNYEIVSEEKEYLLPAIGLMIIGIATMIGVATFLPPFIQKMII